jgi:hypothetical protein
MSVQITKVWQDKKEEIESALKAQGIIAMAGFARRESSIWVYFGATGKPGIEVFEYGVFWRENDPTPHFTLREREWRAVTKSTLESDPQFQREWPIIERTMLLLT